MAWGQDLVRRGWGGGVGRGGGLGFGWGGGRDYMCIVLGRVRV